MIVPCYQAPGALKLTLAGLERQTWPRERLEVIVVDDGSSPPLRAPEDTGLDLRVVRQPRRGFGLARARNAGARAAKHAILLFLDADIIAEEDLVSAHARWQQAVDDVLTIGFCAYVCVDGISVRDIRTRAHSLRRLFAGRPFDAPWLERHMARTGELTSRHHDHFRAVTGHNFAISRALFEYAGGFDESFTRYGGEDTEFAYRAQVRGALLVPVRAAYGWHQGRWAQGRASKDRDLDLQAAKLAELIAEPGFRGGFRGDVRGHRFAVPRRVVTVEAGQASAGQVARAVRVLLADPAGDSVIRVEMAQGDNAGSGCVGDPGCEAVRDTGSDAVPDHPAVHVAAPGHSALDAFPASPIHVRLPATARFRAGLIGRLEAALGDAATACIPDAGVCISRAWSLNRARRRGGRAADYGEARTLSARLLERAPNPLLELTRAGIARLRALRPARTRRGACAVLARICAEMRHVRGPRTAGRFLRWLGAAIRWRLRQGLAGGPAAHVGPGLGQAPAGAPADGPLGARIAALGPRSQSVFRASSRVHSRLPAAGDPPLDAVLADTPAEAAEAAGAGAPCTLLEEHPELAVPAFDPALDNPVGWVRHVEHRVLALGRPSMLPPGSRARRAVGVEDRGALRYCHHVEDCAAFHPDARRRAGALARLAARGVPVRLTDPDPVLERLLGAELGGLMRSDIATADARGRESLSIPLVDAAGRESLSIALRRAALRTHSLAARARQVCRAAGSAARAVPSVSVLLATRRPALLEYAVASVARQRYPRIELVLALHGEGFTGKSVRAALTGFRHRVHVLRAEAGQPLGSVLQSAAGAATGDLLAKMDDDDAYGPEHVWDLVLAHAYSGATLVGKFPATVYLARSDRTVRTRRVAEETWSASVTGGAMLIARDGLEQAGGWRALPRHVDKALVEDVLRSGGSVYRTHHQGYVLVRHGLRHTWRRDDAEFLADAESVHPGWPAELPDMAGVPAPPLPRAHGEPRVASGAAPPGPAADSRGGQPGCTRAARE